jgi:F-type H+-transporting ATPase subunit beta
VINGELDHLPEQAFYMTGGAEQALAKAKEMESA